MKICTLCDEPRANRAFPGNANHDRHVLEACRICWDQHIATQLEQGKPTSGISCISCNHILTGTQIKWLTYTKTYSLYTDKQTQEFLSKDPNYRTCPSASCTFGYILTQDDDQSDSIFNCRVCEAQYCIRCEVPMHKGLTCAAFRETPKRKRELQEEDDRKSTKFIKENAKQCPGCSRWIEKNKGCDHMTCRECKHQFCWVCLAPYMGATGIWRAAPDDEENDGEDNIDEFVRRMAGNFYFPTPRE